MFNLIQSRGNSLRRKVCSSVGSHCALRFWGQFQPLLSVPIVGPFFSKGFFLKVWSTHNWSNFSSSFSLLFFAGSQCEELHPWQRSGGRRLGIHKGGIEPQESPWKFSSVYPPKPESAYFTALCPHLHLWLYGGLSPTTCLWKRVNLQLQLIIIPGRDRSVSTYKLLWRFSSLPDRLFQPHVIVHSLPTVRGTQCSKLSKNRFFWDVRKLLV